MPGPAVARGAQGRARRRDAGRDQRVEQPHVGDRREPRRRGLRGRLLRHEPRRAVAGQPRHLRPEGEHPPTPSASTPRSSSNGSGQAKGLALVDRQPLFRRAAGRQPATACSTATRSTPPPPTSRAAPPPSGRTGDPMFNRAVGGVNAVRRRARALRQRRPAGRRRRRQRRHVLRRPLHRLARAAGAEPRLPRRGRRRQRRRHPPDNILFDITDNPAGGSGVSKGGFGHPKCLNTGDPSSLPAVR